MTVKPLGGPETFTSSAAGVDGWLEDGFVVDFSVVADATGLVALVVVLDDCGVLLLLVRDGVACGIGVSGVKVAGLNASPPAVALVRPGVVAVRPEEP